VDRELFGLGRAKALQQIGDRFLDGDQAKREIDERVELLHLGFECGDAILLGVGHGPLPDVVPVCNQLNR
jgi:hypothetical protein